MLKQLSHTCEQKDFSVQAQENDLLYGGSLSADKAVPEAGGQAPDP